MKLKHLILSVFMVAGLIATRPANTPVTTNTFQLSDPTATGAVPRLTLNATGNPVISWIEKSSDKEAAFYFAISPDGGQTFGPKMQVKAPADLSVHAEGMPKLAQKKDGTWLALFEVPRPSAESRFAGDLLYTTSADNGKTWTNPAPLHRDTTPGKSHSFSDLSWLPNGEIGVVWLDDKTPGTDGRSVRFVQTKPGGGFTEEIIVDDNACQCCRTNILVDGQNRIHLSYRDLLPGKPGEIGARDMSHVVSTDGGKMFSKPTVIVADNWRVNACPHAGISVAQVGNELLATWFSGKEDATGLRLAKLGDPNPLAMIRSNRAKHPQVAAQGNQFAWVWDESVRKPGQAADEPLPAYVSRIALRTSPTGPTTFITPETISATYPAVLVTPKGTLVAYEETKEKQNAVIIVRLLDAL